MNKISNFKKQKGKNKLAVLTAYDYTFARLIDKAGADAVLVGDSLGMVVLGHAGTRRVTMADMLRCTEAVSNGTKQALIVADLPFNSYSTPAQTVSNGKKLISAGAQAVKLEGGVEAVSQIKALVKAGIPVMAHVGLLPQSVKSKKDFKVKGKDAKQAARILKDAIAVEQAGAFAVVLECVPALLARLITEKISIPTVGIGAGPYCDGQVLVMHDMLGLNEDFKPKFVKHFGTAAHAVRGAFKQYVDEAKAGVFPSAEHSFSIDEKVLEKIK